MDKMIDYHKNLLYGRIGGIRHIQYMYGNHYLQYTFYNSKIKYIGTYKIMDIDEDEGLYYEQLINDLIEK